MQCFTSSRARSKALLAIWVDTVDVYFVFTCGALVAARLRLTSAHARRQPSDLSFVRNDNRRRRRPVPSMHHFSTLQLQHDLYAMLPPAYSC